MTTSTATPVTLREFAFYKQAPIDALSNAIINGVITYLLLAGVTRVPVMSEPGESFAHAVMGSLVGPAIIIAFAISLLTTKTTIARRVKGLVLPALQPGMPWVRQALKWGLIRALVNLLVVYGVGGILLQFNPEMDVSRLTAAVIVAVMAAIIAYLESAAAVLRTAGLGRTTSP